MSPDVVIVGAGITGCASAYALSELGLRVEVIEKYFPASMGSGWTLGGVRQSGRDPAELPLAQFSVKKWLTLNEELEAETGYLQHGNLRLARTEKEQDSITALVASQKALGLDLSLLSRPEDIQAIAPQVSTKVFAASFCPTDGHADPKAAVAAYQQAAERNGAVFSCGESVEAITIAKGRLQKISTTKRTIHSGQCLLACGAVVKDLTRSLGLKLPISMALATVVQTRSVGACLKPVIGVADGGITLRQERAGRFWLSSGARFKNCGTIEVQGRPVAKTSIQNVNQVLAASLEICPELDQLPMESFWGGLIDMTPDGLPFLGEVSNAQGVFIGAGFSGHGFGIAPASAHILSTLMIGQSPGLPYEAFGVERFEGQTDPTEGATGATLHG